MKPDGREIRFIKSYRWQREEWGVTECGEACSANGLLIVKNGRYRKGSVTFRSYHRVLGLDQLAHCFDSFHASM
jgi:hypothetical protein